MTIKRRVPFLDATAAGRIVTLPATLRMKIVGEGKTMDTGWDFERPFTAFHGTEGCAALLDHHHTARLALSVH